MNNVEIYLQETIDHLKKSIYHLEYSYQKIDLLICNYNSKNTFVDLIAENKIKLKSW